MKSYPTSVSFLLADMVREEMRKKHTLIGVYAGDEIALNEAALNDLKNAKPIVLSTLCIYAIARGVSGEFKVSFDVFGPDDKSLVPPHTFSTSPKKTMAFIGQMSPFVISSLGKYYAILKFDDREFRYDFSVIAQEEGVSE